MDLSQDPMPDDPPTYPPLKDQNLRATVTNHSLAHWIAQTYKLQLSAIPIFKPDHIPQTAFDDLKAIIKDLIPKQGTTVL